MNDIVLKKIDESNFLEAFNLKLGQGQDEFVSNPVRSLAQAYVYYNQCMPFGIYFKDTMVGYVMIIYDYDLEEYDIWHMMIDEKYQHRGYGQKAMEKCLEYIKTKPFGASNKVVLTCNRDNRTAMELYRKFGFAETGNEDEDEIELALEL
ncbi:MAG: GNAT family N-acetyltransferase [Lachnospiraceae bacterium]|nr:GNAT family N-acetyltransferase [Lachnospiraceae bacterium]